jgi:hypothetical protein
MSTVQSTGAKEPSLESTSNGPKTRTGNWAMRTTTPTCPADKKVFNFGAKLKEYYNDFQCTEERMMTLVSCIQEIPSHHVGTMYIGMYVHGYIHIYQTPFALLTMSVQYPTFQGDQIGRISPFV